jgi:hypothetical protein
MALRVERMLESADKLTVTRAFVRLQRCYTAAHFVATRADNP